MNFEIKLPLFEGPFDLLLFFIERDELDVYDIPIAKITHDFLDYLHHLEKLNIEVASEFILVAATLMRIKAKMLIPRPEIDESGNEVDPRDELIRHLLEYKKYKAVIQEIARLEEDRLQKEARGNISQELKKIAEGGQVEAELQDLDLYKLLKVYTKVIERFQIQSQEVKHTVTQYPYTIADQKMFILKQLSQKARLSFEDIISLNALKIAVVYNFLAILELIQNNLISIHIGIGFNNFWLEKSTNQESIYEELVEA